MSVILGTIVLITLLWALAMYLLWPKLVFSPVYHEQRDAFHVHPERFRPLEIIRDENLRLEGIAYAPEKPQCTVVYFGGREQDSVALIGKLSVRFPAWRICSFNYRGYGRSEGEPAEKALLEDAVAEVNALKERYGDVIVMGFSLGASVAAFAAARTSVNSLVMVAPFYDLHSLAKRRFVVFPKAALRYRFETGKYLHGVKVPVYIFASETDEIVPVEQARRLGDHAHCLGGYKEFSGYNHAELLWSDPLCEELKKVCP